MHVYQLFCFTAATKLFCNILVINHIKEGLKHSFRVSVV